MRAMTSVVGVVVVAAGLFSMAALAEQRRIVGDWIITSNRDRFSGGMTVVAATMQDGALFAARCIQGIFTLAIADPAATGSFKGGDVFQVKFRADNLDVIDTVGDAINDEVVEILPSGAMRGELAEAREYALRITTPIGSQFDRVFRAGAASRALVDVFKACPADDKK